MKFRPVEASLLILVAAIVAVWNASGFWALAVVALGYCLFAYRKLRQERPAKLRRVLLYLGIVPFALWFAAYPTTPGGFSPVFFYIPACYFLFLALLEWRSLGRGGRDVFVRFDAFAAITLCLFEWNFVCTALGAVALLAFLIDAKGSRRFGSWSLFLLLSGVSFAVVAGTFLEFRKARYQDFSRRYADAYRERNLMGFSTVGALGSFSENYSGRGESDVVFRVFSDRNPGYFKGVAFKRYLKGGLWRQSSSRRTLQTGRFVGNYGGFENGAEIFDTVPAWVQSKISVQGVVFAPSGAAGVLLRNIDTLSFMDGDFFSIEGNSPGDWYYFDGIQTADSLADSSWLEIPPHIESLLDSAANEMGLSLSSDSLEKNLVKIRSAFFEHYSYSLHLPLSRREDPLRTFFRTKNGYCEYFASLSTLLLRYSGVPARYVTGFARPDSADGYWIFRRGSAHAWVEFLDAERHWNIFDPTPPRAMPFLPEPSKFSLWSERLRGISARLWHFLTQGSWRSFVDDFGTRTSALFDSPWIWSVSLALILFLGARIFYRRKKRENAKASKRTARLLKMLDVAERHLAAEGFVRRPGETVAKFRDRVPENSATSRHRKSLAFYCWWRWKTP